VCGFGRFLVNAEIIAAGSLKSLVSQNCPNVANRAAVKEQSGCRCVPQYMRPYLFFDTSSFRYLSKYRQRSSRLSRSRPFWHTNNAGQSSTGFSRYRLIQIKDRSVKKTVLSLFPLPIIRASRRSKSMLSRLSDKSSEIRIAVPSKASTTVRNRRPA